MPSESILCLSYFDTVIGPNIFYCSEALNPKEHPDLGRILEFSEAEGNFIFTYRKYQTINHIFYVESEYARGGKELLMITYMIRAAYFKDEITDVYNFLLSKAPDLENFANDLKNLKNFPQVLHNNRDRINQDLFSHAPKDFKSDFLQLYNKYYRRITPQLHITAPLIAKDSLRKVYIFGPQNSGRSTLLKNLEAIQFIKYKNDEMKRNLVSKIYDFVIDNIEILTYDCIEDDKISLYNDCIDNAQAFILMFNASDKDSKVDALEIFNLVLNRCMDTEEAMPILIIGNKFDNRVELSEEFLYEKYDLEELKECGMPIKFYSINVLSDDEIIIEALRWLTKHLI